ncbi:MAG: hypothetical protein HKO57_11945, partial [Akkermansiaceae bacterium]|nr:hypothetical protein [Akkermansiaceae bacterium]
MNRLPKCAAWTAVALSLGLAPLFGAVEINGIAAKVNGKVITKKEVNFHLAPRLALLRAKYPRRGEAYLTELKKAQDAVLEGLIDNKIVLSELEGKGAQLPDHVIDVEVQRIIREVFNGNEANFRKSLQESGMTMRAFRESQREKFLVQAFRSQQFGDVSPATPAEIEAHYRSRRNDLRDRSKDTLVFQKIYIPAVDPNRPGANPDDNLAFAEAIANQLKNGADFAEHAKQHSADAFAEEGGMWPETSRVDLSPAFAEVLFEAPQ